MVADDGLASRAEPARFAVGDVARLVEEIARKRNAEDGTPGPNLAVLTVPLYSLVPGGAGSGVRGLRGLPPQPHPLSPPPETEAGSAGVRREVRLPLPVPQAGEAVGTYGCVGDRRLVELQAQARRIGEDELAVPDRIPAADQVLRQGTSNSANASWTRKLGVLTVEVEAGGQGDRADRAVRGDAHVLRRRPARRSSCRRAGRRSGPGPSAPRRGAQGRQPVEIGQGVEPLAGRDRDRGPAA